jgi:hypothetical protein
MTGKSLFCCASAVKDFKSIVSTLGGPGEVTRANELLARVTLVPNMLSSRTECQLKLGGKIKQRSLAVFSTGDALRAVTVSANEGFIRAAKCQVIRVSCNHIVCRIGVNCCIQFINNVYQNQCIFVVACCKARKVDGQLFFISCVLMQAKLSLKRLCVHFVLRTP